MSMDWTDGAERLAAGVMVHVGRQPARSYRDALRDVRGVEIDEAQALRELERALLDARPVAREIEPEVWSVEVADRRLRVTARVIRWEAHACVLAVSPRAIDLPSLAGARCTHEAIEEYAQSRGCRRATAEIELRAVLVDAKPVDLEVQPEHWRYRSGLDRLDVGLLANRIDAAGTRLVIGATARTLTAGGRRKRR